MEGGRFTQRRWDARAALALMVMRRMRRSDSLPGRMEKPSCWYVPYSIRTTSAPIRERRNLQRAAGCQRADSPASPNFDAPENQPEQLVLPKANVRRKRQRDGAMISGGPIAPLIIGLPNRRRTLGRVLAALEKTKLSSNTIVIFSSDHGEMMGAHQLRTKQYLYEESAAVPFDYCGARRYFERIGLYILTSCERARNFSDPV